MSYANARMLHDTTAHVLLSTLQSCSVGMVGLALTSSGSLVSMLSVSMRMLSYMELSMTRWACRKHAAPLLCTASGCCLSFVTGLQTGCACIVG